MARSFHWKKVSERIQSLRIRKPNGKKETQEEFAERIGTAQANISKWLGGKTIESENLLVISEKCHVSINWLLDGKDATPETIAPGVKEVADLVSEKGRLEEWLNYGRYLMLIRLFKQAAIDGICRSFPTTIDHKILWSAETTG